MNGFDSFKQLHSSELGFKDKKFRNVIHQMEVLFIDHLGCEIQWETPYSRPYMCFRFLIKTSGTTYFKDLRISKDYFASHYKGFLKDTFLSIKADLAKHDYKNILNQIKNG